MIDAQPFVLATYCIDVSPDLEQELPTRDLPVSVEICRAGRCQTGRDPLLETAMHGAVHRMIASSQDRMAT